jgi:hypothetical protein
MSASRRSLSAASAITSLVRTQTPQPTQVGDKPGHGRYDTGVQPLRSALLKQPLLVAAILLAALLLRILVPAGFMPLVENGRLTLVVCSGYGPVTPAPAAHGEARAMPGMAHHAEPQHHQIRHHETPEHQAQSPCAFADLALPAIGGADPIQLAAALLFIVAAALFVHGTLPPRAARHVRPPLRGPPLPA